MRTLAIAATALVALAMSAAPAAAQKSDPDAKCFVATSEALSVVLKHADETNRNLSNRLHVVFGFYMGKLLTRYQAVELSELLDRETTAFYKLTPDERFDVAGKCLDEATDEMRKLTGPASGT